MTRRGIIVVSVAALALIAGVISLTFWLLQQSLPEEEDVEKGSTWLAEPSVTPAEPDASETERRIQVTLYMVSSSGTTLATEDREIPLAESAQKQAKQVIRELLAGSKRGLTSPIPRDVQLRELFITPQGIAYVDLSREIITNHPGGSSSEELTVYSVANTLIANFPVVKKVQILVEGRQVESLAGHLDLTLPYGRGPLSLQQNASSTSGP